MKFTLAWLRDHLETDAALDEIAEALTMIGLEVEAIDDPAQKFAPFIVADVKSAEKHPDADRLKVCMVDTGSETVQVVCGAPNATAGMKGVFAPAGTTIPGTGLELTRSRIRGVESNGMLCSEREMGLSDEHTGIIALDTDAPAGTPFARVMGLDDPVIEIAVTPNRPDCLGVHGIARDLAAAGIGTLKDAPVPAVTGDKPCPVSVTLDFPDGDSLCPAFGLRLVRGVTNGASPAWLQQRLRAIGLRPINALVDITNYITHDRGRPLHVFDAARVNGNLTVRRARDGESLLALDERSYTLDASMCVIADEKGVESLSGIMGGDETGCTEETTDVLIESALWVPENIAETGRRLSILSDARFRFERGVDPAFMVPGLELATNMVLDLCGGTASEASIAGQVPDHEPVIAFDTEIVARRAGLAVDDTEIGVILKRLGFWMAGDKPPYKVAVPSWRPDVHGAADLVEEIVRIVGLDKVEPVAMPRLHAVARPVLTLAQNRRRHARRALAARGMLEAVTWSFVSAREAQAFGGGKAELKLANPIAENLSDMRPSILPGLVAAAQRNADRGSGDVALFEVGPVYAGDRPQDQLQVAAGVRRGASHMTGSGRHWAERAAPADVYDARADALAALAAAGAPTDNLQTGDDAPGWYHPGRAGTLRLGPGVLAAFGELHPLALETLSADGPVAGFEVFLDAIPAPRARATKSRPALDVSDLQPVRRDFAFIVEEAVKAGDLVRAAKGADKQLIVEVGVFDVFAGKALGAGKKSIAIEVTLQPREKTLTDEEIDAVAAKIVQAVEKATGGTLRG